MIFRNILPLWTILSFILASAVTHAQTSAELVQSALTSEDRQAGDADDDARRMPLEVLAFAGIEEGMTILEMEAGGGYYSEILSRAVGPNGRVIRQNPPAIFSFFSEDAEARLANNRLPFSIRELVTTFLIYS